MPVVSENMAHAEKLLLSLRPHHGARHTRESVEFINYRRTQKWVTLPAQQNSYLTGRAAECCLCSALLPQQQAPRPVLVPCTSVCGFISFLFFFLHSGFDFEREMCRQLTFMTRMMFYLSSTMTVREYDSQIRKTKGGRVSQTGQNDLGTRLRGGHQTSDILQQVGLPLWKVDLDDPR